MSFNVIFIHDVMFNLLKSLTMVSRFKTFFSLFKAFTLCMIINISVNCACSDLFVLSEKWTKNIRLYIKIESMTMSIRLWIWYYSTMPLKYTILALQCPLASVYCTCHFLFSIPFFSKFILCHLRRHRMELNVDIWMFSNISNWKFV